MIYDVDCCDSAIVLLDKYYPDYFVVTCYVQADEMIGAFCVNCNCILRGQAIILIPSPQTTSSLIFQILVVILAMEDKRMLMNL